MTFTAVPLDIVGPSYESRSKPLSAQVSRNLYPEVNPTGKALQSWPGAKAFSTGSGANRGLAAWQGVVYAVNGTTLYSVSNTGAQTSIGTITGSGYCSFAGSSSYLYIVTEGSVYRTDGSTLSSVTDSDLETPNTVAFINSQLVYDGDAGRFCVSDAGDGGSINGLNYATAESDADDLTCVYTFKQQLFLFGTHTTETWYNSGVGNPPFDRIEGGLMPVGIAGAYAVTNTDQTLYFLGHDRSIYRLEGYQPIQVSTIAINNAIERYSVVSDCRAFSLKLQGQSFVIFTFPTANKTWAYSETFGAWFELSYGVDGGKHLVNGYVYAYGKHLISDYRNGNVYEWDLSTFTDNSDTIIRERVLPPITSAPFGAAGQRVIVSQLELILERGVGLATGQGSAPVLMISYSDDGGRTWSAESQVSPGVMGDYALKVKYDHFATGYEILYKVRVSDPVPVAIYASTVHIALGGY